MQVRNRLNQSEGGVPGRAGACSAGRLMHPSASAIAEPLDTEVLTDIATGLAATVHDVESLPAGGGSGVRRERLLATDGYDAWVLHWSPGATTDVHDHGGSVGVLHVVAGELVEQRRPLDAEHFTRFAHAAGTTGASGVHEVHSLANPGTSVAVSVHVYSPPLGECR